MAATPLNAAERFSALNGLEVVFIPVVAAYPDAPTRIEIDAGTDLTTEIESWSGFTTTSETIETPDLTRFVGKIAGRVSAEDSSLNIYADRGGDDVRDVLPRDTLGFLAFMDEGDTPTSKMDLYPIQVLSCEKVRSMDAATMLRVDCSMTRIPTYDLVIPAAT
ncbi:hypothetical protein I4I73_03260 [Pseudonocardia sp. KRD-184]|uniref:Uncharacterized protein n=1 Tax=Pseudonocardia oceani TaxID=2792013 RepID=A0ABS6UG10_9PSEU|nr:hypothetical protein [Pseudonocardia oceani]MBW0088233.1 hypothetical protein [Pseudonocardia oceani]MBW0095015.1 hypothetical protein [Pseudonocardia oceani]MBW0121132.1 hypothetical protein [Pseudonocardia oceani]MBW0131182.1 hypothetical protein [Pseudonocardia oceani]MBW0132556.1 hypothetical protein [Pseudonocardia oceani]